MPGKKKEYSLISRVYATASVVLVIFTLLFFGAVFTGLWYF